ncbi:hypothetical protein BZM27_09420 [Paraburkholderia steynii]|uniref:Uncharacterized protein n=1 Tax=Paraburkholderia steynii TaxID=1245441 RepID=A0A4R0XL51_9BURK|nr:hypothetical protein BZM27_09420 [Paraburkholderia steynii]
MFSVALALFPISRTSQSPSTPALRLYVLRFIAHDGTRAVVGFADQAERDERGAQLLALGSVVCLATVRGAA